MRLIVLVGLVSGCVSDRGGDSAHGKDSVNQPVPYRLLGSGEIYGSWEPALNDSPDCEDEVVVTLLRSSESFEAWLSANAPGEGLDAGPDWSSEAVLAATLDCVNGEHPMGLDSLVQGESGVHAGFVVTFGCIDSSTEAREYVVVAAPADVAGEIEASWRAVREDSGC